MRKVSWKSHRFDAAPPGAIATVTVLVGKATTWPPRLGVYPAIVAVSVLTRTALRSAAMVARVLGRMRINPIGRTIGLILAAVAIQFVLDARRFRGG